MKRELCTEGQGSHGTGIGVAGVQEHPNGLKRVKILEATGEGRTSLARYSFFAIVPQS